MKKFIVKLLLFVLIIQIINPINFIGEVFSTWNSWDFINTTDYSLSTTNSNHIRIENSLVRLPYHLEHLWSISDASLDWARRVVIRWNYAFISANRANKLVVVNILDKTSPYIAFILSNWDQWINLNRPMWMAFSWNYLYLSWRSSDNISIINISDPTNLTYIWEISDSRNFQQLNWINDIQIVWNYMYVTSYVDDAFNIFNISNPTNPSFLKVLKDSTRLNWANRARIDWNYAYVTSDRNDSFAIIDLSNKNSQTQNISIIWEVKNWDNWALLDWARAVSFLGNLAYVSSNRSDSLTIIDISDKNNPIYTWSIINWWDVKLNAPRANILYNWFNFSASRSSDSISVIDVSNSTNPIHESYIWKSINILLDWANDIVNSWSIIYVASNIDDALQILKAKHSNSSPYIIPNTWYNYTWTINSFTETLWLNNQGSITYQISYNWWNNWHWFDGVNWQSTTNWAIESNDANTINSNLTSFNNLNQNRDWIFVFKAFLNSDWTQKVELDKVSITIAEISTDTSNAIFHYDGQDINWDWNYSNEPINNSSIEIWNDKRNFFDATQSVLDSQPIYKLNTINSHPSLFFDWVNDWFDIQNQGDINTRSHYDLKTFSMVIKTSDDVNTFQTLYEQWWWSRGYSIQIGSGHLYMWAWNNNEWDTWHQYKFINLWSINPNEVYNILLVQNSTSWTNTWNIIKAYIDWVLAWVLDHVDIQRGHSWDINIWYNNDVRKYDWTSPLEWNHFKWNIWEFISWNYALSSNDINNLNEYLRKRWDLDKVAPIISSSSISSWSILPGANHNIYFNYLDSSEYWTWAWIDNSSWNIILEKWNSWNSSWSDFSSLIGNWILTQTGATYSLNNLDFGKYKITFNISDINGNLSNNHITTFYIDRPELIISTWNINIWELNNTTNTFSDTITITVKTIWAPFRVKLKKNQNLTHSSNSDFIPYYNWIVWMWYDKNNDINLFDFNNDIIMQEVQNINTNWNLNTYTYTLKIWAIIESLQAWWNYSWKIDFGIEFDY